jgi:hypothetical protein
MAAILKVLTVARGVKQHLLGNKTVCFRSGEQLQNARGRTYMLGMLVALNSDYFKRRTRVGLYNTKFRHVLIHECVHACTETKIGDRGIGSEANAYGKLGVLKNAQHGISFRNAENYVYAFGLGEQS